MQNQVWIFPTFLLNRFALAESERNIFYIFLLNRFRLAESERTFFPIFLLNRSISFGVSPKILAIFKFFLTSYWIISVFFAPKCETFKFPEMYKKTRDKTEKDGLKFSNIYLKILCFKKYILWKIYSFKK